MSGPLTATCSEPLTRDFGYVLQMQSMSVNDGEGIRTVIFLPGCPLRCRWCANPETWTPAPKLAVYHSKCTGCGACETVCPASLFPPQMESPGRDGCTACGECVTACPSGTLKILNHRMALEEVVRKVERDAVFFRASGGGVTFSGGEPTVQTGFLRALVTAFYERGIDICIETCGYFPWEGVEDIFAKLDRVLYDIKHMDPRVHKELTGVSNERILENCVRVARTGVPVTVRVPVISGVNGTQENLEATARFIREELEGASIELLPYHDLGTEKYRAIGQTAFLHDEYAAPSAREMEDFENMFRRAGVPVVRYR
ncbi:MAG: 4-hydroxyphenylacetate decarboxylase activating enzyme [Desulfovibrio sp.]